MDNSLAVVAGWRSIKASEPFTDDDQGRAKFVCESREWTVKALLGEDERIQHPILAAPSRAMGSLFKPSVSLVLA